MTVPAVIGVFGSGVRPAPQEEAGLGLASPEDRGKPLFALYLQPIR